MEELDAGVVGQVLAGSPDAVVIVDKDGVIRYWNRGAERIFGHPASEAVGATLDLIVPERMRERHWEGFNRTMETGETRYGDDDLLAVPAAAAGGRTISVEFSVVLVEPEGG
ncbi:MAG TPA: PAS domain-containing protein, partial [Acidimicrobiales bacterium]|nr:PAS domain-containing protein [Acidimicrobiales bacterium]